MIAFTTADLGLEPLLLDTQYRMHPMICQFPSHWFYNDLLLTGISADDRPAPLGIRWPDPSCPVLLITCNGQESQSSTEGEEMGMSYENAEEARLVMRMLWCIVKSGACSFSLELCC